MFRNEGRKARLRALYATVSAIVVITGVTEASAQDGDEETSARTLDSVLVTARKKEENLLTVPLSVSVVAGADLEKTGVQQLGEALQAVPGVSVTPTPVGDLLFIRGIGSGENQGFEMSVGTFIDGVYYGRGRSSRHAFLDIDRIEVLKGPQPILFGKNTIGGALNITTRKPTDAFEFSLDEYVEPEFGTFRTTAVVSGPISETLRGRLVARHYTTDGFVENNFLGTDAPSRDDWVARGILVWEPSDTFEATLKAEYGEAEMEGGRSQITKAVPSLIQRILPIAPNAEFNLDHVKSGPGTNPPFNREFEDNTTYNGTLTAVWDLGAHDLTSVSSYVGYDVDYSFDSDFTPLDFIQQGWDQRWHSWSQELRIASTASQTFEYQAGVYLASEELESFKVESLDFGAVGIPLGDGSRVRDFHQQTDNWSAFAEGTWNATDELSFIFGYRYTDDKKTLDRDMYFAALGSTVPNPDLPPFTAAGLGSPYIIRDLERTTSNDSLAFTVRYQPGDLMYYASYTQGFKAGGFDEGDSSGILDRIIFDDETADSYEIGLKGETLNRRLRFEAAAFYSEYDDLQVSIFDGVAALLVGNAASATSSGLEFQSQFAATDQLTLGVSSTFLNSEYDSYEAGPCSFGQGTVCDLSGKTLPYAPEFSGAFNASWADTLSSGWGYELQGKVFHTTEFSTAGDLDPAVAQDAFSKVDASLTFTSPNDTWTLALVGKNLTDETTAHFGDDIPLSNLLGNNYQQYVDPPRTLAFQVKYRFQ